MHSDLKSKNLHRIKIIKGHVTAIEKMMENDEYCIKIIHQSLAVQKALKKLDMEIMDNHLNHCVLEKASTEEGQKAIKELIDIYNYKL